MLTSQTGTKASSAVGGLTDREFREWPVENPRILVTTCMKDEGPFILEWLAWHRAIGVTDFVVFTNHCTDGTDRMLDHLHDMGEVTHLPNPALATGSTFYQPVALAYLHHLRAFREADFVISMDVDEFINLRPGQESLAELFGKSGPFDALSMTELNHGSNRQMTYSRGWITEQFPLHETETPGKFKARHGVKTITRLSPLVSKIRNHRPDFSGHGPPARWLDGSGRVLGSLAADASENGIDCRGTYGLVSLDHFPLRSLDSYLMKMLRGDVVVADKQVSQTYWRVRNRNHDDTSRLARHLPKARAFHERVYAPDARLMAIHDAACAAHEDRITTLGDIPALAERKAWILQESW